MAWNGPSRPATCGTSRGWMRGSPMCSRMARAETMRSCCGRRIGREPERRSLRSRRSPGRPLLAASGRRRRGVRARPSSPPLPCGGPLLQSPTCPMPLRSAPLRGCTTSARTRPASASCKPSRRISVSAAVRLVPLGQTAGLRVVAALEPMVLRIARETRDASLDDLGSACFRSDLASMRHETQYTRLFRS